MSHRDETGKSFKNDMLRHWPMNDAFREIELRRQECVASIRVCERELENCRRLGRLEEIRDHATQQLVMTLRAGIYGKQHPDKHVIRYPSTWWDALKERFAPAWFRDRHPVRFTEVTASLSELYPDLKVELPDKSPVLKFVVKDKPFYPVW